ncbi:MAG: molecular chaperone DnaJ [Moorea sp. SIO2B7]|nr:molecular chaperone DnaJ [Moorena sp. SIO2B7]
MSTQNPYEKLGVTENASFEEIQEAKKRLSQKYREDSKVVESIDAAYDAIIMDRLRMRQEGRIKVPEKIRFPERASEVPQNLSSIPVNQSPAWVQRLIDTPSRSDILWSGGLFLVLAGLAIFAQSSDDSLIPLLTAFGFAANVYFLNRKEQRFGRAILITMIGLLVGIGLGSVLAQPLANGLSELQFISLVTFCVFWLISSFIR